MDVTVRPVPTSLLNTVEPDSAVFVVVVPASPTAVGVTARVTMAVDVCPLASVTV